MKLEFSSDAFCIFVKCIEGEDDSYSSSSSSSDGDLLSDAYEVIPCACERYEQIEHLACKTRYILHFISQNSVSIVSYGVSETLLDTMCLKSAYGVSLKYRIEQIINQLLVASTLRDLLLIQLGGRTGFVSKS